MDSYGCSSEHYHLNISSSTEFYAGVDDRGNLSGGQQKNMDIDKRFKHPNYSGDPNYNNDLALVKVNSDFSFNGNVEMIKLATSSNSALWTPKNGSTSGSRPYVSGFGHTVSGGSVSNNLKRAAVEVTLVNNANNKIIAGGNYNGTNYDACQGDSGGPLYANTNPNSTSSEFNVLIGTVNGGTGCGEGGAYMNVSKFIDWIVSTIHTEDTPNFLCGGTTITLENIGKLPDGCTMTWSVLEPFLFSTIQTNDPVSGSDLTPTFTLTAANGVSGEASVRITLQIPNEGTKIIDKKMWVGLPASPINIVTDGTFDINGSNATICRTFGYCMTSSTVNALSTSGFSYSGWPTSNSFFGPPTTSVIEDDRVCFGTNNTGSYFLTVYANNICGAISKNVIFQVNNCGFRVFPNPAQTTVAVEFEEPDKIESIPDVIDLVEEKTQKKVKSKDVKTIKEKEKNNPKAYGKIEIDVSDLPRGVYYLNMSYENKNGSKIEQIRIVLTDK